MESARLLFIMGREVGQLDTATEMRTASFLTDFTSTREGPNFFLEAKKDG